MLPHQLDEKPVQETSEVRKEAWLSSNQVGVEIKEKLLQLVHIRNENACALD